MNYRVSASENGWPYGASITLPASDHEHAKVLAEAMKGATGEFGYIQDGHNRNRKIEFVHVEIAVSCPFHEEATATEEGLCGACYGDYGSITLDVINHQYWPSLREFAAQRNRLPSLEIAQMMADDCDRLDMAKVLTVVRRETGFDLPVPVPCPSCNSYGYHRDGCVSNDGPGAHFDEGEERFENMVAKRATGGGRAPWGVNLIW